MVMPNNNPKIWIALLVAVIGFCAWSLLRQFGGSESVPYIDISRAAGEHLGRKLGAELEAGDRLLLLQAGSSEAERSVAAAERQGLREGLAAELSRRSIALEDIEFIAGGTGPDSLDPLAARNFVLDWNTLTGWLEANGDVDVIVSFLGVPTAYADSGLPGGSRFYALIYGYSDDWRELMRAGILDGVLVRKMKIDDDYDRRQKGSAEKLLMQMYDYYSGKDLK
jgi:hypothetical protein